MNSNLLIILLLCAICVGPVTCISRWFSATYNDLKFTMYRYSYCVNGLQPLTSSHFNETEYLINQVKTFLDQGNYDNEQLANVTLLMDDICQTNPNSSYAISVNIDINKYSNNHTRGKEYRCRAIDDAMDSMYHVFKRAALNHSEPLDFSAIQFSANETDKSAVYNLTDLINTSWINSETVLEHVCVITNATKEYVQSRSSNSTAQPREQVPAGYVSSLLEFIDRLIEPVLGLQKRLYWEGTTRLEVLQGRVSSGLGTIRSGIGNGLGKTRQMLFGARTSINSTSSVDAVNSTINMPSNNIGKSMDAANITSLNVPKSRSNVTSSQSWSRAGGILNTTTSSVPEVTTGSTSQPALNSTTTSTSTTVMPNARDN